MLRPELDVQINAQTIDGNLHDPSHWVIIPRPHENDVDEAVAHLEDAVERQHVAEQVENAALARGRELSGVGDGNRVQRAPQKQSAPAHL